MPDSCIEIHELEEILRLPRDDSRRRHLETCPRCRAVVASYKDFLDPADAPPDAHLQKVKVRLGRTLDAKILGRKTEVLESRRPSFMERIFPRRWSAYWRPALVLAGLILIVFTAREFLPDRESRGDRQLYRGAETQESALVAQAVLLEAGEIRLSWTPMAEADEYRVRLFGADLLERAEWRAGADTVFLIPGAEILSHAESSPLFWTVSAFRNSDLLGESALGPVPTRP